MLLWCCHKCVVDQDLSLKSLLKNFHVCLMYPIYSSRASTCFQDENYGSCNGSSFGTLGIIRNFLEPLLSYLKLKENFWCFQTRTPCMYFVRPKLLNLDSIINLSWHKFELGYNKVTNGHFKPIISLTRKIKNGTKDKYEGYNAMNGLQ